jgi:predicted RND superfamily exporter protein
MDLYLDSETPDRMLDLDALTAIAALEQRIEALPQVDKALSHVDIVRRIHQTIGGSGELPGSREAIAQELLLFEMGGGSKLSSVLDFERKGAHMALQTRQRRMRGLSDIGVQIEEMAAEILPPDIVAHSSGMIVLSGGWLEAIIDGQKNGVLASIFSIGLLMMIGLRNIKIGLLSMIPNLLPLIVVAATTGLVWTDMDSDTLVILMMAIGIGVDDTIHFLTRLKTESARSSSRRMAIERTFSFAGRAIVMTTIILALGFLPMALSPYYSIGIMGSLLPLALIVAMAADLLLLPAMAEVGWLNFPLEQTAD